jgi:hypothetical protein
MYQSPGEEMNIVGRFGNDTNPDSHQRVLCAKLLQ